MSSLTRNMLAPNAVSMITLIAAAVSAADDAAAMCQRLLLPLEREDGERKSDLLRTLASYYDCGARVDRTAERLFLHRNSVRYRLDRIRSLLGWDIDKPDAIASLTVALAARALMISNAENMPSETTQVHHAL